MQNPEARIHRTNHGKVVLNDIMGTKIFDLTKAETMGGSYRELIGKHTPETEEYGIRSFVYLSRKTIPSSALL